MAHGTGRYWQISDKNSFHKNGYWVFSFQLHNYYHELYSDSYEPTHEILPEYRIEVAPEAHMRKGWLGGIRMPDNAVSTGSISKDEANKILWNIKNRDISYAQVVEYFNKCREGENT